MFTMRPNINMAIFIDYQNKPFMIVSKYVQIHYSIFFAPQGSRSNELYYKILIEDSNWELEFTYGLRASPRVCQNLLDKSYVLPTSKKLCKVKKSSSPIVWHNSLAKSRSNLHQES
jgi:hypothetical protein